jgi:hypothetical protein
MYCEYCALSWFHLQDSINLLTAVVTCLAENTVHYSKHFRYCLGVTQLRGK